MSKNRPQNTPLEEWPPAWLKIEVASLLDTPGYIMMGERERAAAGYPATDDERRALIRGRREADAYLLNPTD